MRTPILFLGLFLGLAVLVEPAQAQTIAASEAAAHAGQTVTVEGAVSDVHTTASGMIFIDMGGHYPDNAFTAVIFAKDAGKFPSAEGLEGKTVDVTGKVRLYKGRPEIVLDSAAQLKTP